MFELVVDSGELMNKWLILCTVLLAGCGGGSSDRTSSISGETLSMPISWERPSEFENGDPLHPSEIESFHISWKNGNGSSAGEIILPGYKNQYKVTGVVPGSYQITITSKTVYGTMSVAAIKNKELVDVENEL